jgi:NADH-quinone oxidoreductase subunit C
MKDEELLGLIQTKLPDTTPSIVYSHRLKLKPYLEKLHDTCSTLLSMGFDHLQTICVTDYPQTGEFEFNYIIGSVQDSLKENIIMVVLRLPRARPIVPTVKDVWPAAVQLEREEFEMLGVRFEGNPELKFLYLPEDWNEIPPLLKDYKLKRWVDEERDRHDLVIERVEHEREH